MLVVIASRYDTTAQNLVARWAAHDAVLLTSADLSIAGWRHYIGSARASTAVASGRVVDVANITGVLTRLPWVVEAELPHIVADDRTYVATEMSAFLLSWLSSFTCPVINRPQPGCLIGPNWREAQWPRLASKIGIPARATQRHIKFSTGSTQQAFDGPVVAVTVVGDYCFGLAEATLNDYARRISKAAGVDLLTAYFSEESPAAKFLGIRLCPEILSDEMADAVLERLSGGRVC
jgi:hypothetical protein